MKMFRVAFVGLASGATMLFATSAWAGGDLAPERPFTWTGFYVGGQIGVAINEDDFGDPARVPPTRGDFNANGFIGGGHLGYNIQSGIVVYGIEGDFEWSNASGSGTGFIPVNAPFVTGHLDENWQGSVRARLGIASHRTLFYVTGGSM